MAFFLLLTVVYDALDHDDRADITTTAFAFA
jgi:hypothetical protein